MKVNKSLIMRDRGQTNRHSDSKNSPLPKENALNPTEFRIFSRSLQTNVATRFWGIHSVFLIESTNSNLYSIKFQHVSSVNGDHAEQVSSFAKLFYWGGSKYLCISTVPVVVINQNQTSVQCVIWKMKNCCAESNVSLSIYVLLLHSLK